MAQAACSRLEPQPKFFPAYQDLPGIGGVVEHEIFFRAAVAVIAPVAEEVFPESVAAGGFEETGGDDLVGVDVLLGRGGRRWRILIIALFIAYLAAFIFEVRLVRI